MAFGASRRRVPWPTPACRAIALSFTLPASAMAVRAAAIGDITIRPAVQG